MFVSGRVLVAAEGVTGIGSCEKLQEAPQSSGWICPWPRLSQAVPLQHIQEGKKLLGGFFCFGEECDVRETTMQTLRSVRKEGGKGCGTGIPLQPMVMQQTGLLQPVEING